MQSLNTPPQHKNPYKKWYSPFFHKWTKDQSSRGGVEEFGIAESIPREGEEIESAKVVDAEAEVVEGPVEMDGSPRGATVERTDEALKTTASSLKSSEAPYFNNGQTSQRKHLMAAAFCSS